MLTAIVFLPLLAGVITLLAPERSARWIAAIFTGAVFLLSLWLYFGLLGGSFGDVAHPQWYEHLDWINVQVGNIHFRADYALGVDGLSILMLILNSFLSFLAVIGSWNIQPRQKFYMALILFLETGVAGVFASFDLFLFIFFWEVELIPMFLLIGIWGGARREYAAWKFLLYTLIGSVFTLGGIFLIYFETGGQTASFQHLASAGPKLAGTIPFFGAALSLPVVIFILICVAFAVKMPTWPVHTWLPDAHTEAPTAVSVLLAGILLKMGAYGLIRIGFGFLPQGLEAIAPWVGILGALSVLWGAGASMVQRDMKRMIAYSSVSHMGYISLGVAAAAVATSAGNLDFRQAALTGASLQMLTHGVITGMLFFCVGVLYDRAHTREIDVFGGIGKVMPVLMLLYSFACFTSLGLPGGGGFVSEYLTFTGAYATLPVQTILAVFGVVLTAGYLLWMLRRSFYGALNPKWSWLTDATLRERSILVALVVVILFIGIYPAPFVDLLSPSLHHMLTTAQSVVAR
ncbi:MAG TPA: NADH-quinone oxidoreductase subunit M [Ktedonobacterales bacterium]